MTAPILTPVIDVSGVHLEDSGPLPEATGVAMATRSAVLWRSDDGGAEAGVWSCEPGPSRWALETHEFIYVAEGRMRVTRDGSATTVEIGPGQSAFFEKGWAGTWEIEEALLKSYVIF